MSNTNVIENEVKLKFMLMLLGLTHLLINDTDDANIMPWVDSSID